MTSSPRASPTPGSPRGQSKERERLGAGSRAASPRPGSPRGQSKERARLGAGSRAASPRPSSPGQNSSPVSPRTPISPRTPGGTRGSVQKTPFDEFKDLRQSGEDLLRIGDVEQAIEVFEKAVLKLKQHFKEEKEKVAAKERLGYGFEEKEKKESDETNKEIDETNEKVAAKQEGNAEGEDRNEEADAEWQTNEKLMKLMENARNEETNEEAAEEQQEEEEVELEEEEEVDEKADTFLVVPICHSLCLCYTKTRNWDKVLSNADMALEELHNPQDERRLTFLLRRATALSQLANPAANDTGFAELGPDTQVDYLVRAYDDFQSVITMKGYSCTEAVRGVQHLDFILKQLRFDISKSKSRRHISLTGLKKLREMKWPD